ncbi:hypothetical protein [Humisphaera borealis]|uniref:Uncharacterized protein n=1 Tax=Humisphaera borealis TaxID=2807512 RepID=A0A7M2WZX6_9BACT|nr:hypothetical protein [Humisphaera borealis]QOV90934.1 hypothetical protein IPV69_06115 [Humisphaera borealis]
MNSCWKCRASLRVAEAAFCPVCGAGQRGVQGGPPPIVGSAAPPAEWTARIERTSAQGGWGRAILWTILFPLAPFTHPILLMAANNRLRRHVSVHLQSPALQTPRAQQSPEGRAVLDRLATSAGRVSTAGILPMLLSLALAVTCGYALFIVPTQAPKPIRYERAVEQVLEVRQATGYVYVSSPDAYESFWINYPTWAYDEMTYSTSSYREDGREGLIVGLPQYQRSSDRMSSYEHPPYEFVATDGSDDSRAPRYHRVSSIYLHWDGTETAGIVFWISAIGLYIVNAVFGMVFWFRFMRHRQAEVLAAAFARGDPAFHDRLMPIVSNRNTLLSWVALPLAVTGLHLFAFPLLSTAILARHADWEGRSGIAGAFGVNLPDGKLADRSGV